VGLLLVVPKVVVAFYYSLPVSALRVLYFSLPWIVLVEPFLWSLGFPISSLSLVEFFLINCPFTDHDEIKPLRV
jgi:hypothetical protein